MSLSPWIPAYLHDRRRLMDASSDGTIQETEYIYGDTAHDTIIHHNFEFNTFHPFGSLDDFALPTAWPGESATWWEDFAHDVQQAFCSGYLRQYGLKAQVDYLPIGVIGSVFVTKLRQNDNGVQNIRGLNNYLLKLFSGVFIGGLFPYLYCDGIFWVLATMLPHIVNPTPELWLINMQSASLWECIEYLQIIVSDSNYFQYHTIWISSTEV